MKRQMNILCLTDLGAPGAEDAMRWLKEAGHHVTIVTLQPAPPSYIPKIQKDIPIHYVFTKRKRKRISIAADDIVTRVKETIQDVKPDMVLAFFATYYGWLAYLSGFRPYVITAMNADINFFDLFSRKEKFLTIVALEQASGIVSVSKDIQQRIAHLGAKNQANKVIWVGADTRIFKPCQPNRAILRKLAIEESRPLVLSPRAFHETYNVATILKAIPAVLSRHPETVFLFTSYRLNANVYEKHLRQLVKDLNIAAAVRFMSIKSQEAMADLYNLSRCFISVPSADGTPASLHEGMACNTVPIVSPLPTTNIWIKNGTNGIIIKRIHPNDVANAVIQVLGKKPEESKKLFQINRRLIKQKAEFNSCRRKEENFYKMIIKRHSTGDVKR
jgi:glycosyltransferase involved in cell wall biosynthesis